MFVQEGIEDFDFSKSFLRSRRPLKVILAESSTLKSHSRGVAVFSKSFSRSCWLFKVILAESLAFQSRPRGVVILRHRKVKYDNYREFEENKFGENQFREIKFRKIKPGKNKSEENKSGEDRKKATEGTIRSRGNDPAVLPKEPSEGIRPGRDTLSFLPGSFRVCRTKKPKMPFYGREDVLFQLQGTLL